MDDSNKINQISAKSQLNGILIIEDDPVNCKYLKQLLKDIQTSIFIATNATESRNILSGSPEINLILIDIQLPDINGLDLASEFRQLLPNAVILAQTAHTFIQEEINRSGCNDFINKPILKGTLYRKIEKYFIINQTI